ncbi:NitT/TauT family transport system substrate-binding protein [Tistlia consotensis]|uniref:NitT/TauT family transport system substrate-binding protein n=1 Tax=Tistlia consotensis USBA 355 TaxID=560819 RepID=A0A1Y6CME7_9PROT|nr:ABC transporter substrate-binding protein [Tistlia consotensis]SMF60030.1 NitT/TauT family transport system substrate-binding protein [Tistlia consotensis USBA 355]SNR94089.1 NitT/TauT family transport system substrate-binding protein [Tistlia consotensis]
MRGQVARLLLCLVILASCLPAGAQADESVRVAVLKFGTVNWELDTVQAHGLDRANGIALEMLPLAGKSATSVSLQAGAVDMMVTDWVWVARQRAAGMAVSFLPYSTALGAVMVPSDSPVTSLADLAGRKLGVAGGPLDKSWLLLQALARRQDGLDLATAAEPVFGAPPLLNEQLIDGRLDAVVTFWPYAARLEARGYRRLLGVADILQALGFARDLPLVGYVFDERWAQEHPGRIEGFVEATAAARRLMAGSDAEWQRLRPLMQAEDDAVFRALRDGFRAGIPGPWGKAEQAEAARLFELLRRIGGPPLVGTAEHLPEGTFWQGSSN